MKEENKDYHIKLLKRFCRAHPSFFTSDKLDFILPSIDNKHTEKILRIFVNKEVNWIGHDDNPYDVSMSDDECCRDWLETVMKNKSFQTYWKTLKFDSLEELEVKLVAIGF